MWTENTLAIASGIVSGIFVIALIHSWFWHVPNKPPRRPNPFNRLWRWLIGARYIEVHTAMEIGDVRKAVQNMPHTRVKMGAIGFHMRLKFASRRLLPGGMRAGSVRGTVEETDNGTVVRAVVGLAPIQWLLMLAVVPIALIFAGAIFVMWGQVIAPNVFGTGMDASFTDALLFTPLLGGFAGLCLSVFVRGWQRRRAVIAALEALGE